MFKGALVGAVIALATGMTITLASAETPDAFGRRGESQIGIVVKESHIARLKAVLNLTAEQRPHWGPVEAALRDIARQSREEAAAGGLVQRMSDRASAMASEAMRLRRLGAVARPLISVLDDTQKRDAMMLVRQFGFDRLVAAF
jgi:hypothetical protein